MAIKKKKPPFHEWQVDKEDYHRALAYIKAGDTSAAKILLDNLRKQWQRFRP